MHLYQPTFFSKHNPSDKFSYIRLTLYWPAVELGFSSLLLNDDALFVDEGCTLSKMPLKLYCSITCDIVYVYNISLWHIAVVY